MAQRVHFGFPGDLQTLTGGYAYDRKIMSGLRQVGWRVDELPLGAGFPRPDPSVLQEAGAKLTALADGDLVVIDGLAFGVMDEAARHQRDRLRIVALVHHPLCLETGISSVDAAAFETSERAALSHAAHIIVTSPATGEKVQDLFGIHGRRVSVILPGTDRLPVSRRSSSGLIRLLAVGTVVPRKGYDLLFQALAESGLADWQLDIVGSLEADPVCAKTVSLQTRRLGISDRITFHGALDPGKLTHFYSQADVFVLASRYEGYGMAYTEALSSGLPVIGSGAGAVAETLSGEGAIYCGVEDVPALRRALERVISSASERETLARAARKTALTLPSWEDMAVEFGAVLKRIGG